MKRPTSEWLVHADVGHNDILQHNKHTKTQHPSRRSRGDMIETYKLLTGKYDQQVTLIITLPKNVTGEYFTRGSCNKLLVKRCRYEPWKNFLHSMVRWFLKLQMLRAIRWAWNAERGYGQCLGYSKPTGSDDVIRSDLYFGVRIAVCTCSDRSLCSSLSLFGLQSE